MFRRADILEVEIERVFGSSLAQKYRLISKYDYIKTMFVNCICCINLYPNTGDLFRKILRDELENLLASDSTRDNRTAPILISCGLSAYAYWDLSDVSIQNRLERLELVPPGWRMDTLSGSQYWLPLMIGQPEPVRAWMVEINSLAAASAWSTTTRIEILIEKAIPRLPYVLHGLALDSLRVGFRSTENKLSQAFKSACQLSSEKYAEGFANNILEKIVYLSKNPIDQSYYDSLSELARQHNLADIDSISSDHNSKIIAVAIVLEHFIAHLKQIATKYIGSKLFPSDEEMVIKHPFVMLLP